MRLAMFLITACLLSHAVSAAATVGDLAATDPRNIRNGLQIPAQNYCDQPYVVVTTNGEWVVVLTTGTGSEGSTGQHIVSARSADQGQTWSALTDIEPSTGPAASWAAPLLTPDGRIYVFYTYNGDQITTLPGGTTPIRADTLGWYCFKYSDDNGQTWSAQRYRIPLPVTACDLANQWGGTVQLFWGIDKPKVQNGVVRFAFTKLGWYMLENGEGWVVTSDNLLTERNPDNLHFAVLPDGSTGIRNPVFGSIQEEHNLVPLDGDDLFCVYRLNALTPAQSVSRDGGHTWSLPERMTYGPGARTLKQPRACPKLFKTADGRFLFWFHNHSGSSFENRNPVFLSGGTLHADGFIRWSEPEILLFDPTVSTRMSYPDLIEQDGRYWVTETQKTVARAHAIDTALLEGLWNQASNQTACTNGLLAPADLDTFGALAGRGLSLELLFKLYSDAPGQTLFSKTDAAGKGVTVVTSVAADASPALTISLSDGTRSVTWDTDPGKIVRGRTHHAVFICDFSACIISVVLDGSLCDGDEKRQYGWGRIPTDLESVAVTNAVTTAAVVQASRLYGRALRTSEAVGSYRSYDLPEIPPDNSATTNTIALWRIDNEPAGQINPRCLVDGANNLSGPLGNLPTNEQFAATVPNPDRTPGLFDNPTNNAGSARMANRYFYSSTFGARVDLTNSFTVEGWYKIAAVPNITDDFDYLVGPRGYNTGGWMLDYRFFDGKLRFNLYVRNGGASTALVNTGFTSVDLTGDTNVWRHVALGYARELGNGVWNLFLDGTLVGAATNSAAPQTQGHSQFYLGGRGSGGNTMDGFIDYWRVSDAVLTPEQFLNYPAVPPPVTLAPKTVAYWRLDLQDGTNDLKSYVNGAYRLLANVKTPFPTNALFAATVPNSDTSADFIGDARANHGAVAFSSSTSNGYLSAANLGYKVDLTNSFTVEGWTLRAANPLSPGASYFYYVAGARDIGKGWMLSVRNNSGVIGYNLYVNNGAVLVNAYFPGANAAPLDTWQHLALTYTGTRSGTGVWELFLDGVSAGTLTNSALPSASHGVSAFYLGGRPYVNNPSSTFMGLFDCWRISDSVLTPTQFLNAAASHPLSPQTLGYWKLDASGGTPDLSSSVDTRFRLFNANGGATATNIQARTRIPNPDTSPAFIGNPTSNVGSVFFRTPGAAPDSRSAYASYLGLRVDPVNSFTTEGWLRLYGEPDTTSSNGLFFVAGNRRSSNGWMLTLRNDAETGKTKFHLFAQTPDGLYISSFFDGADFTGKRDWMHVALVHDRATADLGLWEFFLDGISRGVLTNNVFAQTPYPSFDFELGGRISGGVGNDSTPACFDTWRVVDQPLAPRQFLNYGFEPGTLIRVE